MKHFRVSLKWGIVPIAILFTGIMLAFFTNKPGEQTIMLESYPITYDVPKRIENPPAPAKIQENPTVTELTGYILKIEHGSIIIHPVNDPSKSYDTGIADHKIPYPLRQSFQDGYYISDEENLYGFLEDYTS